MLNILTLILQNFIGKLTGVIKSRISSTCTENHNLQHYIT